MSKKKDKRKELLAQRNGEVIPPKNGGRWSEDERKTLILSYYDGEDLSEIALFLERSESSIYEQLKQLITIAPIESRRCRESTVRKCKCSHCTLKGTLACPRYKEAK